MEDLKLSEFTTVCEDGNDVVLSYTTKNRPTALYDYHMDHEMAEDLHSWLAQWLKENPVKVEKWVLCCADGDDYIFDRREALDEHLRVYDPEPQAIIPISYHIGEGLEEEDED